MSDLKPTPEAPKSGSEIDREVRLTIALLVDRVRELEDQVERRIQPAMVRGLAERVVELEEAEKELLEQDGRNLAQMVELADQRDSARYIAVALEQQLARVRELHVRSIEDSSFCDICDAPWPCNTLTALDGWDQS